MNIEKSTLEPKRENSLCGHCAGSGQIESMDYGGTTVCRYCHGSGLEHSEPCYVCGGRGLLVNRNRDAYTCNACRGVGRMPNVRIIRNTENESQNTPCSYTPYQAHHNAVISIGSYGPTEGGSLTGVEPQMSYEYAPPADAEAIPEQVLETAEHQLDAIAANFRASTSAAIENLRRVISQRLFVNPPLRFSSAGAPTAVNSPSPGSIEPTSDEKFYQCLRIAQLIFRNTIIASDTKIRIMASLLTQLPDNDIETIRNLLGDSTVEQIPEKPKSLNRFQILKQV